MKVKICGITDSETAKAAVEAGADALGFVFARSKRKITPDAAESIIGKLPAEVEKVGVFVDEDPLIVKRIVEQCGLNMIQLHGRENPDLYKESGVPVIKAFGIAGEEDVAAAIGCRESYVLADSPKGVFQGGNGHSFDWSSIKPNRLKGKKVILAGGLHAGNVVEAILHVQPFMVDVSSGVETDGRKDVEKIKRFIEAAKGGNNGC